MATLKIEIDRTYPKNDPTNAAFVRNLVYTITEPNQQNGLSFANSSTGRAWSEGIGGPGNARVYDYGSKNGCIRVSGYAPAVFPAEEAKDWTSAFKSAIAYYIQLGAIIATDSGAGVLTADAMRNY